MSFSGVGEDMRKHLLVVVFFAVIIVMCAFTFLGVTSRLFLYGTTDDTEKPVGSTDSILDGTYQSDYDTWYKENYPYRDYVVKTYNQFKYSVFNKSSNSNLSLIGDAIIETGYINNTLNINITSQDFDIIDRINVYAEQIYAIQTELEKKGKMFIYIITPSKDYLYLNNLPIKYTLNDNTDINQNIYTLLVEAFNKLGINYYDSYCAIDKVLDENKYYPYHTTGSHWNFYASAVAVQDIIGELNEIYGCDLPAPVINGVTKVTDPQGVDCDIYDLLNIWKGRMDDEYYIVDVEYHPAADYIAPNIMYFGTSFQYQLLYILEADGTYAADDVFKYFQKRDEAGDFKVLENNIFDINLEDLVNNNNLFVIENVSSSFKEPQQIFVSALSDYLKNGTKVGYEVLDGNGDINISLENTETVKAVPGEILAIPLTLNNETTNITLSSLSDVPFYLSYHILDSDGKEYLYDGIRTEIEDINPLSSLDTEINIEAPTEKGRYILQITFVQENRIWGENYSDKLPVELELVVE